MVPGPALKKTKLPKGFYTSSVNCGVRKYRPDIGIVVSESDCVAVGMFTLNNFCAAPVSYCKKILPSTGLRAIITNSGQANAGTGEIGAQNNLKMVSHLAAKLGVHSDQVAVASTGIIGVDLEVDKINRGIDELVTRRSYAAEPFATAIMTTDLIPKTVHKDLMLSGGEVTITGICKGSGMIHPNMATMLGFILTDAQISVDVAKDTLKEAVDQSFNMISVDGDTSTNDSMFFMANGQSEVAIQSDEDIRLFKAAINEVSVFLAKSIAADGEGATKLIEVSLKGLDDLVLARKVARGVVSSPLIKCAIHGEDPNWGRIYSRLGQEGVTNDRVSTLKLWIQGVQIVDGGRPISFDYYQMKTRFGQDEVSIELDFGGKGQEVKAWGCDLTKKYIDINTEYN